MKKITLFDFRKLCAENRIVKFTFSTLDQKQDSIFHTIVTRHWYNKMFVQQNPNQVCFMSDNGETRFERIKYVVVYTNKDSNTLKFSFVCGNQKTDESDIEYILYGEK